MSLLRILRIAVLLTVLIVVAGNHWLGKARLADWDRPLWITVYPIIADDNGNTRQFVTRIGPQRFGDIGAFLARQSERYGRHLADPLHVQLAAVSEQLPPAPPAGANRAAIAWWSLRMRWWAWLQDFGDGLPEGDIQIFILYRSGQDMPVLDRSLGIREGRYAVVNAFAESRQETRNRVVLAHELLHVLGATDKYDPYSGQPLVPQGLADPGQQPLYPQSKAEIMGGRIALSGSDARMPSSLRQCVIGFDTAREIGWLKNGGGS